MRENPASSYIIRRLTLTSTRYIFHYRRHVLIIDQPHIYKIIIIIFIILIIIIIILIIIIIIIIIIIFITIIIILLF